MHSLNVSERQASPEHGSSADCPTYPLDSNHALQRCDHGQRIVMRPRMLHWKRWLFAIVALPVCMTASARTVMLSSNDGIEGFDNGQYVIKPGQSEGSLTALDMSSMPPQVEWTLPAEQTAVGPPSAIAVTPDGTLAIVSNTAVRDPADPAKRLDEKKLQVFDLSQVPARLAYSIALDHRPWGISISPSGKHGLVANGDGTVTWLNIDGKSVTVGAVVTLGAPALHTMSTAFTKDGRWALVARRGDATVTVLRVDGDTVTPVRDIVVGSNPYEIVISPDGKSAAVSDIGHNTGDRASVTFIDLTSTPFRAVDVLSVGPTPESITFSPDSKLLAVNSINGSNLKHDNPFYTPHSLIQLFDLTSTPPRLMSTTEVGTNAQGLAFAPDGKSLVVQDFASDSLLVFGVAPSGLTPLKDRVPMPGAPSGVALFDAP